ncbi:hypothetical protein GOBAR_DD33763 [Gossypium barbadense]|nr:hypothetical protein GOBAR_DD33763 [Gossypium barbadense]
MSKAQGKPLPALMFLFLKSLKSLVGVIEYRNPNPSTIPLNDAFSSPQLEIDTSLSSMVGNFVTNIIVPTLEVDEEHCEKAVEPGIEAETEKEVVIKSVTINAEIGSKAHV